MDPEPTREPLNRDRLKGEYNVRPIDLADAIGVSPSYISLILSGKREPPLHVRSAIARALGARVKDLWPREQEAVNA
jgi:transcriptional regulator with XRE-family HTH domain